MPPNESSQKSNSNLAAQPSNLRTDKDENQQAPLDELSRLRRNLFQDNVIRPSTNGVLSVHIVKMIFLELEKTPVVKQNCYCSISVLNATKKTHVVLREAGSVVWNQTKHFPVQVPISRRHPFNLVRFEIIDVWSSDPTNTKRVGFVSFHLHDIISASPVSGIFEVWDDNHLIGDIVLEITFNYGLFGYGYASQLKEEKRPPDEMIMYSLFPRINPDSDRMDPDAAVLDIKSVPHPSFIPFKEKVFLSYAKELEEMRNITEKEYIPDLACKDWQHLSQVLEKYYSINDRVTRLAYLQNLLAREHLRKEAILDDREAEVELAPKVHPDFVQPFNLPISINDDVVFDALTHFRSDLSGSRSFKHRSRHKTAYRSKPTLDRLSESLEKLDG